LFQREFYFCFYFPAPWMRLPIGRTCLLDEPTLRMDLPPGWTNPQDVPSLWKGLLRQPPCSCSKTFQPASLCCNPGKDAEYQADRAAKALKAKTFHCVLCDLSFGTRTKLEDHLKTPKHFQKQNNANSNSRFKCLPCNQAYHNQFSLNRHLKSNCHRKKVALSSSELH
jgi:hypothetical protein